MLTIPEDKKAQSGGPSKDPDAPPPYEDSEQSSSTSRPPPTPKPMNHVTLVKLNGSVRGKWAIDTDLQVPAALQTTEESKKNLLLKTPNGTIEADVTIMPSAIGRTATLEAETMNGAVRFALHDGPKDPAKTRPPVKLVLSTHNGTIRIRIPRSFRGVIEGECWWGSTDLSSQIEEQLQFSEQNGRVRRVWIGEYEENDMSLETWTGDSIKAETRCGNVKVCYDDEVEEKGKGLWSRIWNSLTQ